MKKIIALTDFSQEARHAVNFAADVAIFLQAELIIFHTVEVDLTVPEYPVGDSFESGIDHAVGNLSILKTETLAYVKGQIAVHTKFKIGQLHDELETIALHEKPFAVFMASRGLGAVERFFFGSNSIALTKDNFFPVIIVPQLSFFSGFKKIAFSTDLNEVWENAPLTFLRHWLKVFKPQLDILHVAKGNSIKLTDMASSIDLQNNLAEFGPQYHFIENSDVGAGIMDYVKCANPGLLIMAPKKHGWFSKSHAAQFITQPPVPVMVLPHSLAFDIHEIASLQEIY